MTEEQIALARRAVACKAWRWMPGMRWMNDPAQPVTSDGDEGRYEYGYPPPKYGIPDLRDPATLGCVLAMVRSVYTEPRLAVVPWRRQWAVDYVWLRDGRVATAPTEAEALVAALEAAP